MRHDAHRGGRCVRAVLPATSIAGRSPPRWRSPAPARRRWHSVAGHAARPRSDAAPTPGTASNPRRRADPARRPGLPVFPASNVWNARIDTRPVAANSATMIAPSASIRGLHMDFGSYAGLRHPVPGRDRDHAALHRHLRLRRRVRPRRLPDPGQPEDRGRLGPPHPHGRPRRLPPVRAVRRAPVGRRLARPAAARPGTCARTRCGRPAGRAPTPPACRSCPASSATTRSPPAHPPRPAVHDEPTRNALHLPGPPLRQQSTSTSLPPMGLRVRLKATLDTTGFSPQAKVIADRAQALRDDPRRQRLALVHHRRERPALRRRRHARARRHHGPRPRGRRHDRAGQRPVDRAATGSRRHGAHRRAGRIRPPA